MTIEKIVKSKYMSLYWIIFIVSFIISILIIPFYYQIGPICIVFFLIPIIMIIIGSIVIEDEIDDINQIDFNIKSDKSFEIVDSSKQNLYSIIISILSVSCIILFIGIYGVIVERKQFTKAVSFIISSIIVTSIILTIIVIAIIKVEKPIKYLKFFISTVKVELYLQNKLYFQLSWKNFERIEMIKQRYSKGYPGGYRGICPKFKFIGINQSIDLNLIGLPFKRKKKTLIVALIKQFAEKLDKDFFEYSQMKMLNQEETYKIYSKIKNFAKKAIN